MVYTQNYHPLASETLSTLVAALPVLALFWLLVVRRVLAPWAAAGGAATALLIATIVYRMPALMAGLAFVNGALFGLLPICWTIANAMFLYNITVVTGRFERIKQSVAGLSADHRLQAVLIAFAFGAFLEGAAGGGTPVAICAAMLVGLGFEPFYAAAICLPRSQPADWRTRAAKPSAHLKVSSLFRRLSACNGVVVTLRRGQLSWVSGISKLSNSG